MLESWIYIQLLIIPHFVLRIQKAFHYQTIKPKRLGVESFYSITCL